jgi:hypothetical protein
MSNMLFFKIKISKLILRKKKKKKKSKLQDPRTGSLEAQETHVDSDRREREREEKKKMKEERKGERKMMESYGDMRVTIR